MQQCSHRTAGCYVAGAFHFRTEILIVSGLPWMVVSSRSDRAGQSLIPKLFWPGALDCKTAFGRSFFFAAINGSGAGPRRGLRQKTLALPRRSQQWPRRLHAGAIQDHQAWVHPPCLLIVDATDLPHPIWRRLRHRGMTFCLKPGGCPPHRW
jgi:hypothetical protein